VWWLVLGVGLAIAELFTGTFVLVMISVGAFAATAVALLGAPVAVQMLAFAAASAAGLLGARPSIQRRLHRGDHAPEVGGLAAIEGAECEVLELVDLHRGLVRIGGEMWTARSYDATQVFQPGERVRVIEVKGATALVWRD
jgi:membrane protein implicated in regulation of membrane protease activity